MNQDRYSLSVEGEAYRPNSSARLAGQLVTRPALHTDDVHVDILDEDGLVVTGAPLSEITVDPVLGRSARRMHFPDGALFTSEDHDAIAVLTGRGAGETLHKWEAFHPRLIGVVVALVFSCFLLWRYGLDLLVGAAIALTPPIVIEQIDRGSLGTIDRVMGAEETQLSAEEQARIQGIFDDLLAELSEDERAEHNFNLNFRDMERIGPNAFALPGGTILMTDQFVEMFPGDDTIAGVLGHEIGHVVDQHGLQQTYRALGLYVLIGFLAGDTGPLLDEVLLEGNLILSLRFSREHEREADEYAVQLADAAGYDPAGLLEFFEVVSDLGAEPVEWLSTHPNSSERVKQIEGYIEALE
ncbi:MAG: M48 family metallopeptidase [Litoreibacter sp.]|nr:M48 family metallopeptidase [Litoreibacter sp.]